MKKTKQHNEIMLLLKRYSDALIYARNIEEEKKLIKLGKFYVQRFKNIKLSNYARKKYCIFLQK